MYFPSWKKIAKLKHYTRAGMVVTTVSWGLIILFMIFGLPGELAFSGVVLPFFATAALVAHLFSNATYIAGTMDLFKEAKESRKVERWVTLIGLIVGFVGGVGLSLTLPSISFFTFLSTTTVTTGAIAGLANRFGGIKERHPLERYSLIIAAITGAAMACTLIACGVPFLHVTGVISFITAGPPVVASSIFICLVTSLFMSGADYFSKMLRFLPRIFSNDKGDRRHEYEGSCFGAIFSLVAIIFFAANLHLLAGTHLTLNTAAITITLFAKCFGVDGICSRIGRTLDGFIKNKDNTQTTVEKVLWVVSGAAGLMVMADIGFKIKDYVFAKSLETVVQIPKSFRNDALRLFYTPKFEAVPRSIYIEERQPVEQNRTTLTTTGVKNPDVSLRSYFLAFLLWNGNNIISRFVSAANAKTPLLHEERRSKLVQ